MVKCSRCKKRLAVIFANINHNGENKSQGFCIKCAKEVGIPVEGILGDSLGKFGLDPEQMEDMEESMSELIESGALPDGNIEGGAPAIDFAKLMGNMGMSEPKKGTKGEQGKAQAQKKRK